MILRIVLYLTNPTTVATKLLPAFRPLSPSLLLPHPAPLDSKKGTISYQLGWTLPLSDEIRSFAVLTNSKRKILACLCISVPALTFYFARSSKDVRGASVIVTDCLFLSSVCSFQEGGQWLWWGKKKSSLFLWEPVTLLAQFQFSQCISATLDMNFCCFNSSYSSSSWQIDAFMTAGNQICTLPTLKFLW